MALGADTRRAVVFLPMDTKAWAEREASKRGLGLSTYLRSVVVQMHERAKAQTQT